MADLIFVAMMVITVGGALLALEADEIVYGAIALAGSLFGVAALFFLLSAPYVAVFQITIYVGAIAVLILFTVMLVRQEMWMKEATYSLARLFGILAALAIAATFALSFAASRLYDLPAQQNPPTFFEIGQLISTNLSPILLVLALVLAASVLGAITLAKVEREEH